MSKGHMHTFWHRGAEFLASEFIETSKIYIGNNLTHAEINSEVFKNGNVAHIFVRLYINGATTGEQDKLKEFVKKNNYPNLDTLYISKYGSVYKLWGHLTYHAERPFILMNVNNVADQFLVDDEFVRKFFTDNSSIKPTKGQL